MASTMAQSTLVMAWATVRDEAANNMVVLPVFFLLVALLPLAASQALAVSHSTLR
jgi:hypothetical protein